MVNNFKIGDYFDFRLLPSVSLSYRKINYTFIVIGEQKQT